MKRMFYCVLSEFYDNGTVKACMVSREADKLPNNQFRHVPGMAALKLWFLNVSSAIQLLDLIKKGECSLDDVLQLYSGRQEALWRKGA